MRLLLFLLIFIISGCATYDMTNSDVVSHIVNRCYVVQRDSFLVYEKCADFDSGWGGINWCSVLVTTDKYNFQMPKDYQSFDENESYWQDRVQGRKGFFSASENENVRIMNKVPAGEKLTVMRAISFPYGEGSRYWVFEGVINTGELKGKVVQLSSPPFINNGVRQLYIEPNSPNDSIRPEFNKNVLRVCDEWSNK